MALLNSILNLDDFEAAARRRLPRSLFGFASNGSERGASVVGNTASFSRWTFVPDTLVDVSEVTQECSLFGSSYASPFGIAPMGGTALFRHRADMTMARAAHARRVPFMLSGASSVPLEEIMQEAPGSWYQAYAPGDTERIGKLLDRLRNAGVDVLVLTVDVPVASNRDLDRRLGFSVPLRPSYGLALDGIRHPRWLFGTLLHTLLQDGMPTLPNFTGSASDGRPIISTPVPQARLGRNRLTWEHVAAVRRMWNGPLVLKGILSPMDARKAVGLGADGLIVSNHGGRQLDGAVAPLDALIPVLDAAGSTPVCIDGGVRRGTDALKALALGARMVFLGRPVLYAAAVGAGPAVEHAIQLLQREIEVSLALLGCQRLADIRRDHVRQGLTTPVGHWHGL